MTTQTKTSKTIQINPAAPFAGIAGIVIGAMLFGFGLGVLAPVPTAVGMIMLFCGLFIMAGLLKPNESATHRRS